MKLLPIVQRELLESCRRRGTYWLRTFVAFQAVLIGIVAYFVNITNPLIKLGTVLFWGLSGVSMLFCLFAGRRSTADCLSQEKRDGTLGLLFLTDLKGYDVVLGKLAATSFTGLYALLAVFPVLAVPLLTGGMTNGEVERMVIVLTNTFFFSISIGIFASAISREYRAAMATNFFLWLIFVGAPAACAIGLKITRSRFYCEPLFYSCPIYSFILTTDTNYTAQPDDFWWSVGVTHALSWVFAVLACLVVPFTWGDKPAKASTKKWRWRDFGAAISYGSEPGRIAFRRRALDANAYFWHAACAWLKPFHTGLFLALAAIWWFYCWAKNGRIWLDSATFFATAIVLNSTLKLWITLEAGMHLGEDRRSGAFELLLATPLTVSDIIGGQLMALRRQFLKPLLVVIAIEFCFLFQLHMPDQRWMLIAAMLVLPLDIAALICVAMRAALTAKSPARVNTGAVIRILILPWLVFAAVQAATALYCWIIYAPWEPKTAVQINEWFGLSIVVDLAYGIPAWMSLNRDFRPLATQTYMPVASQFSPKSIFRKISAWTKASVPRRFQIATVTTLGIIAALAIIYFNRASKPHFPPPLIVSITHSNAPLQIFPSGGRGVFIVLPDGSLWRWGRTAGSERASMPERLGTNTHWTKVVSDGRVCLGLDREGALWQWGIIHEHNIVEPDRLHYGFNEPYPSGRYGLQIHYYPSNNIDIAAGALGFEILDKNGGIRPLVRHTNTAQFPVQLPFPDAITSESISNWTAISSRNFSFLGLRSDGTLWTWGDVRATRNFIDWESTNVGDYPVLVCNASNWTSLNANGQARNKAGELWDASFCLPKSDANVAAACHLISTNSVADHIESAAPWLYFHSRIRPDGTLWTTMPVELLSQQFFWQQTAPWHRIGTRSDWVSIWGIGGTSFGLTADGTLWVWGLDDGVDPRSDYKARFRFLQSGASARVYGNDPPPPLLQEPRPLLKIQKAANN
jgi:ABC-type transport system involved in multi-copper enzyme maturation permease subunit